jgi:hypothetical protein
MTIEMEPSLMHGRARRRKAAAARGALTLLAGGSVLAACGSSGTGATTIPPTATPTAVCTGTTANPGYST